VEYIDVHQTGSHLSGLKLPILQATFIFRHNNNNQQYTVISILLCMQLLLNLLSQIKTKSYHRYCNSNLTIPSA